MSGKRKISDDIHVPKSAAARIWNWNLKTIGQARVKKECVGQDKIGKIIK